MYVTLLFFIVSKGGPKEKNSKTKKKAEKVQPNVLIGLLVHFPFHAGVKKCHFGNFSEWAGMAVPC